MRTICNEGDKKQRGLPIVLNQKYQTLILVLWGCVFSIVASICAVYYVLCAVCFVLCVVCCILCLECVLCVMLCLVCVLCLVCCILYVMSCMLYLVCALVYVVCLCLEDRDITSLYPHHSSIQLFLITGTK